MIRALTLLTLVGAQVACSSDTLGFCLETSKIACQVQYRCCTAVERSQIFGSTNLALGPYADEGGCVDAFTRQCEAASQAQDEAIAAQRLQFDKAKADECVQGAREAADSCDATAFFNGDPGCNDLVSGLVADGDDCFSDGECAESGSACEKEPAVADDGSVVVTLAGTCKGKGDQGEPCLDNGSCNGELRCLQDPQTFTASCVPPRDAGEPCQQDDDCAGALRCAFDGNSGLTVCIAPAGPGDPCSSDVDCSAGLACLQGQVCGVQGGAGSPCFGDDECLGGLLCAADPVTFTNVCTSPSAAGEPCPGGDAQCEPGLQCLFDASTSTNLCAAGAAGDPCDAGGFNSRCTAPLICRFDPLVGQDQCQAPLAANATCDRFAAVPECASNLRCIADASFNFSCEPPLAPAAPCTNETQDPCDGDHACSFDSLAGENICVALLGPNASCFSDDECAGALFCDTQTTDDCIGRRNANQACTRTRECAPGLECRDNDTGSATICRALSAAGAGCATLDDCAAGLDCRSDDAGLRFICRGASAAGQRCDAQGDCAAGLDCRNADDGGAQICRALSVEGEGCVNALDCVDGFECRSDPVSFLTVCLGPADVGETCSIDENCQAGLVCRFDNVEGFFQCTALGGEGAACTQDSDCSVGFRCRDDGGSFVCTERLDDFTACDEDTQCLSGFCDPDSGLCGDEPAEIDFEICDGI